MILFAVASLSAYVSWLLRNAGEGEIPTRTMILRLRFEAKFPVWSQFLDCLYCSAFYAALIVAPAAAAVDLIPWRQAPLVLGLAVLVSAVVETTTTLMEVLGKVVVMADEEVEDDDPWAVFGLD